MVKFAQEPSDPGYDSQKLELMEVHGTSLAHQPGLQILFHSLGQHLSQQGGVKEVSQSGPGWLDRPCSGGPYTLGPHPPQDNAWAAEEHH